VVNTNSVIPSSILTRAPVFSSNPHFIQGPFDLDSWQRASPFASS
jgi:hypothetical protein